LGKAQKYGQAFIDTIAKYVEENEIERPTDITIKTVANKSRAKINIITAIDRKIPLEDIAKSSDMTMQDLMEELYAIVQSGTKLRLDYYINKTIDEYVREVIMDYFKVAETDDIQTAVQELRDEEVTWEEVQLMRLKFLSDYSN
ncbi:MAG: ATP-dependent DNA helicase RecQ, partial [Saprospiraceae bacterium]